jgi:hypothetical protein
MIMSRLALLLSKLTVRSFKPPPKGVGLKTIFVAREAGLIEIEGLFNAPMCKLTDKGRRTRDALFLL